MFRTHQPDRATAASGTGTTTRQPGIGELAEGRLRSNSYLALKNVSCEGHDRVLTLRGCLPSYYLKQVAQAVVAEVNGVERIDNQIDVVAPARGGASGA